MLKLLLGITILGSLTLTKKKHRKNNATPEQLKAFQDKIEGNLHSLESYIVDALLESK